MGSFLTWKLGIFNLIESQVPIHIFIIPHAKKIYIPPSPIQSRPDSLASRCQTIVIFIRICIFINKLFKIRSDILYDPTGRISSAMSPTILLLYRIHPIFQILVCPKQELELWIVARKRKATLAFCVTDSLFLDILLICKIWLVAQNISSHL